MKKSNVAFLVGNLELGGGGERTVCNLANGLSAYYCVHIFHFGKRCPFDLIPDVRIHNLSTNGSYIIRKIMRRRFLQNAIRENDIELIVSFGWQQSIYVLNVKKGSNYKWISSERNNPVLEPSTRFWRWMRDRAYRASDYLVFQTKFARDYFNLKKSTIILNPIKECLPTQCDYYSTDKVIVTFCRLYKQKNIPLLIDAFELFYKNHNDYRLMIYGDGEEYCGLVEYIKKKRLDKQITIHPFEADIHSKILNSKMYVSSSDYEGLSNSMLEAMAMGMPTIVTDCPVYGARAVIKNGLNGFIVPMSDPLALSDTMGKIADNYKLAVSIGKNAKDVTIVCNIKTVCEKWKTVIDMVLYGHTCV